MFFSETFFGIDKKTVVVSIICKNNFPMFTAQKNIEGFALAKMVNLFRENAGVCYFWYAAVHV